jgi:hypothetical protein
MLDEEFNRYARGNIILIEILSTLYPKGRIYLAISVDGLFEDISRLERHITCSYIMKIYIIRMTFDCTKIKTLTIIYLR